MLDPVTYREPAVMRTPLEALETACRVMGGQQGLADALSAIGPRCTQPAIHQWFIRGVIPEERCEPIEAVTAAKWPELSEQDRNAYVSSPRVEELRPDLGWERNAAGHVVANRRAIEPVAAALAPAAKPRKGQGKAGSEAAIR